MIEIIRECRRLGCRPGESAKEFHRRDPQAAQALADWMKAHPDCFNSVAAALTKKQRVQSEVSLNA